MSELGDVQSAVVSALTSALGSYTVQRGYTDPSRLPVIPGAMVFNPVQSSSRERFGQRSRVITLSVFLVRYADPPGVTTEADLVRTELDTAQAALEGAQIGGTGAGVYVTAKGIDETDDSRVLGALVVEVDLEA